MRALGFGRGHYSRGGTLPPAPAGSPIVAVGPEPVVTPVDVVDNSGDGIEPTLPPVDPNTTVTTAPDPTPIVLVQPDPMAGLGTLFGIALFVGAVIYLAKPDFVAVVPTPEEKKVPDLPEIPSITDVVSGIPDAIASIPATIGDAFSGAV